ncbi:MAG TPA: Wzz/FepE/Etk N-terminal domain-containing protein, partial [Longimicrobium sp.]
MITSSLPRHTSNGRDSAPSGISPVGLAVALGRNWGLVLATALVAMLAGLAFGLIRRPVYSAQTLLFLSQPQTDSRSQLAAQFSGGGGGSNAKLVTTVLSSRTLAEAVGREAGKPQDLQVQSNVDGSIRITVSHENPQTAARIANAYPKLLNSIVSRAGTQTNRQKEGLLERQIVAARQRLEESENALVRYQTGRNATDVEGQANATLNAAVALQQRIAEK